MKVSIVREVRGRRYGGYCLLLRAFVAVGLPKNVIVAKVRAPSTPSRAKLRMVLSKMCGGVRGLRGCAVGE